MATIAIADSLMINEKLETLDLGYNLITDDGACAIAGWVKKSEIVERIMLNYNKLSVRSVEAFIDALEGQIAMLNTSKMRMLNLMGIKEIPESIKSKFHSTKLELAETFSLKPFLLSM